MVIISPCLRTKDYCFLTISCTASKYCCLLKQYTFCFLNNRQSFWFWLPWKRNLKLNQIPLLSSNSMQSFKQIKQHTPEILHFHFFIVLQHCARDIILKSENEAENLQNGDVHPAQIPDFETEYFENHLVHSGRWWLVFFFWHFLCSSIWA